MQLILWKILGPRNVQVQHAAKGDVRAAGVEASIIGRHPDDRPNARTQASDNQQGRLGKPVSNQ